MTDLTFIDTRQPRPPAGTLGDGTSAGEPPVSIVIPALNEENTVGDTVGELRRLYPSYELLVIDDGSDDRTGEVARSAGARVLRHRVNRGYGASLKHGMRKARAPIVVFIDADGQHDARDVERLVTPLLQDGEMVIGARTGRTTTAQRRPGKWLLAQVAQFLVDQEIPDLNSGLRAFRREEALRYLPLLPNGFSLTTTLTLAMIKDGYSVDFVPIQIRLRSGGRSTVKFFRDGLKTLLLIMRAIMLFNPLKIFVPLSALLCVTGVVYASLTLALTSNLSDAGMLLILSGLGALGLGLLADQIANLRRGG